MRLRRLELVRYGRFEDRVLEFGAPRPSDVTVVYGANEAGKSTAFSAWLNLLYGLPLQTPYAYRHDRKDMRIGAAVDTDDGPLTLYRTGRRQGSLTDENGREISETRLRGLLHGLDLEAYRTRFSLDDKVLRDGGEEIARAQGDLGQLLHAGSSGLSGLTDRLAEIEAQVDGFHKKGGRKTRLAEAKRDLKALETEIAENRLSPRDHDALRARIDAARDAVRAQDQALTRARRDLALCHAAQRRNALAREIAEIDMQLADLPAGPDLPPDAVATVSAAAERLRQAQQAGAAAQEAIAGHDAALADLPADAPGLQLADLLDRFADSTFDDGSSLPGRVATAEADLDKRRGERADLMARMSALADRLGVADPAALAFPQEALDGLAAGLRHWTKAQARLTDLTDQIDEARARLGAEVTPPTGLDALQDALTALRRDGTDPDALLQEAQDLRDSARRAAIGLPDGWRALAERDLPEEAALIDLGQQVAQSDTALAQARQDVDDASAALAEAQAACAALMQDGAVTDDAIAQSRAARDAAWDAHLARLDRDSARAFEAAMRQDDDLRIRHASGAEARALLRQRRDEAARADQRLRRAQARLAQAETGADEVRQAVADAAQALGLPPDGAVGTLRPRRAALAGALDAAMQADGAERRATAARTARAAALDLLAQAMQGAGADPGAAATRADAADRLLARLRSQQTEAARQQEARDGLARLNARLLQAQAATDRAAQAVQDHLGALGLDWPADTLEIRLPVLADLAQLHRDATALEHRIGAMQAALQAFEGFACPMRALLDLPDATRPTDLLTAARARARAATDTDTARRRHADARVAEQDRQSQARREVAQAQEAIDTALRGQAIDPEMPAQEAVQHLHTRDALRAQRARLCRDRDAAGAGLDPQALHDAEAQDDPLRSDVLERAVQDAQAARDAAQHELGGAEAALTAALHQAGGAEADQRRAAVLEELREEARLHAARLLGLMAARGALRRFREERRGAMLRATEAAFRHLTHGAWDRLETRPSGKTEQLVGIRAGEAVTVDAMSTGTRGQLYLALRIAGHADFVADCGPLPFVTDDIHETFDDARAQAALELAAEMGQRGQVLVFTHHRHLVDIARDTIDDVRVLDLDG